MSDVQPGEKGSVSSRDITEDRDVRPVAVEFLEDSDDPLADHRPAGDDVGGLVIQAKTDEATNELAA